MRKLFACAMTMYCVLTLAGPAMADDYPSRPVRLLVGFAPGGTTDISARLIAQAMSELWGQQVVVENRPGASTLIAAAVVAQAPPDGYTLFHNSNSHVVAPLLQKKVAFDPIKDFTPIGKLFTTPAIILVNNHIPAHSLAELLALARGAPDKLSYGIPGYGTITHLAAELFKQKANVDLVAVAYRGGALSLQAVMSGEVPMTFNVVPEVITQIQAGGVRAIAVTSAKRAPLLPDVPTVAETVPGYQVEIWQGWFGPAGLPAPLVAKIHADLAKVPAKPEMRQRFAELGAEPAISTPEELLALMREEQARWTQVIQVAGIQAK